MKLEKVAKHTLNNYMLAIDHFWAYDQRKKQFSFSFIVSYCNQELRF